MALSPEERKIAEYGVANGKSKEQVIQAIAKYREQATKAQPTPAEKPGVVDRVKGVIGNASQNVREAVLGQGEYAGQNVLQRGVEATAAAFNAVPQTALAVAPEPVRQGVEKVGEKVGEQFNKLTQFIGSNPDLQKWVMENPDATDKIINTAKTLQAGGEIAGNILGAQGTASTLQKGADVSKVAAAKTADAVSTTANKAATAVGNTVAAPLKPEAIMQRVARIPKGAQAKFEATSGESIGTYLTKRGIYGNTEDLSKQLYDRFATSKQAADDALAALPGTYKPTPIKTVLKELLDREKRVSTPGALSPDFKVTRQLYNKLQTEGLTMTEINTAKRLYERNVRLDFVKQNLPEGVARATNLDNALREWQFTQAKKLGLQNLPDINKETRLAKQLLDAIGKESAGSAGNNAITLTDYILLAGGDPTAISAFVGKKLVSSKGIQSSLAKNLYKGETVGTPKAEFGAPKPGLEEFMNR